MSLEERLALFNEGDEVTLKAETIAAALRYTIINKTNDCIVISHGDESKEVPPFLLRTPQEAQQELDEWANAHQTNYNL